MSDTRRRNSTKAFKWLSSYAERHYEWLMKRPAYKARAERDEALLKKGADGHNAKDKDWRFDSAREDGSGKLNTYDETGPGRRKNTVKKRKASKDTRRYGKRNLKKELGEDT